MKLSAEIKDGKFIFEYEVGKSSRKSTTTICPDSLIAFTEILRQMSHVTGYENREFQSEVSARTWIEKNRDEVKRIIDRQVT